MHSTLKSQDPFNFRHCIGVHARTLHLKGFIYIVTLDIFLPNVFRVYSHDNLKNISWLICVTKQKFNA